MNFSVLNWNIQGKRHFTVTKPEKIFPVINNLSPDIICLQEAKSLRVSSDYETIKCQDRSSSNVILSRFPITQKGELIFPKLSFHKQESTIWADVAINGTTIRLYNCHFGIVGMGPKQRIDQLKIVIAHSKFFSGPTIICGDFNTTIPKAGLKRKWTQIFHAEPSSSMIIEDKPFTTDERYPFANFISQQGFKEATDLRSATWCINLFGFSFEVFKLKLDWFLTKNVNIMDLKLGPYISDHRYILSHCQLE